MTTPTTDNGLAGVPCVAHGTECDGSTDDCEPITGPHPFLSPDGMYDATGITSNGPCATCGHDENHVLHIPRAEHEHEIAHDLNGLPYCVSCWRSERLWIEPGDIAELTFYRPETGETEQIRALCVRPSGAGPGWVLSDGTRLPLRPRPVIKCDIVYPPAHRASEIVIHPIPEPADDTTEHTTQETDQHDRDTRDDLT